MDRRRREAVVTLVSGNTSMATVPASVTVPAGALSATFTVTTLPGSWGRLPISAKLGVQTVSTDLIISQPPPDLAGLSVSPATVAGGTPATGTVSLTLLALSGGSVVSLSSSNPTLATVPSSVTVAAGQSGAVFTITTAVVTTSTPVTITATYNGVTKQAVLTLDPLAVSSLTLSPPRSPAATRPREPSR